MRVYKPLGHRANRSERHGGVRTTNCPRIVSKRVDDATHSSRLDPTIVSGHMSPNQTQPMLRHRGIAPMGRIASIATLARDDKRRRGTKRFNQCVHNHGSAARNPSNGRKRRMDQNRPTLWNSEVLQIGNEAAECDRTAERCFCPRYSPGFAR